MRAGSFPFLQQGLGLESVSELSVQDLEFTDSGLMCFGIRGLVFLFFAPFSNRFCLGFRR